MNLSGRHPRGRGPQAEVGRGVRQKKLLMKGSDAHYTIARSATHTLRSRS